MPGAWIALVPRHLRDGRDGILRDGRDGVLRDGRDGVLWDGRDGVAGRAEHPGTPAFGTARVRLSNHGCGPRLWSPWRWKPAGEPLQ
ncbi:hypothetical protein [Sinosporangium siamense]|uniref:Uncharacterized protein n=1 Tax=Sinosporangium siamense TaxID=1367973 RepID=A0A919RHT2_9ACTN|nr:hypothetical protein [Sinosporangium siamense]GII93065.1 hypothetical protein Ssi02_32960 [Sinosporangium siamense]